MYQAPGQLIKVIYPSAQILTHTDTQYRLQLACELKIRHSCVQCGDYNSTICAVCGVPFCESHMHHSINLFGDKQLQDQLDRLAIRFAPEIFAYGKEYKLDPLNQTIICSVADNTLLDDAKFIELRVGPKYPMNPINIFTFIVLWGDKPLGSVGVLLTDSIRAKCTAE